MSPDEVMPEPQRRWLMESPPRPAPANDDHEPISPPVVDVRAGLGLAPDRDPPPAA